jgi:uncharacterized protein YbjT (DUF2867 family)
MTCVAVLGATGQLGEILVNRALASGHEVHAFARDPTKLQQRWNERLTLYRGAGESAADLEPAVEGCPYIISAFDPQKPVFVSNLLSVVKAPRVERFVFMSRLGVGDSMEQAKNASGILTALRPRVQRHVYEDFSQAEGLVRASPLPFVILRATALDDSAVGQEVVVADAKEAPPGRVARSDLAKFIMRVLEEPGWERREVTVGAKRS